ncbi:MAG: CHAT domain-containing protein, partial [Desulfobulbaceae bacterium]|nr:CHAT domain-containing protein [Desulfobulbaceae bacterium]
EATQPAQALTPFANAIDFAEQAADFSQYLPPLYDYARECAFLSGDLKKAAEYAAKSVALLARTEPDTDKHAEALLRLGLLESRTEAFDQAIGHLEEAQDIFTNLESPEGALQAMNNLGLVLENATAYDRALHLFMDAAALSQQLAKGRFTGQQYSNIGRVYDLRLNNFAKASEYYAKGAALFAQAGDHKEEAVAQLNIGRCARLLGDFQEAEARYSRALDLASSLTLPAKESADLKGRILLEQANNHWYQARYDQALRLDNEVLDLAAASDLPPLAIMARNTAGLILWTLGQPQKALVELERALTMAKSLANRPDEVSTTLNNLGLVYRELGQLDQALVHLEEALAIDTRLGSKWALAYDLRNKGQVLLKKGEVKAAIPLFRQAADYAAGIGNRINEAKCALWLATALEEDGQDEESGRAFAQARTLARSMALKEVEWRAIFGLARRQLAQKNSDGAKGLLLECMDLVESMRAEIRIEQLRDSFISDKLDAYETLVALLVERGETGEAFAVAERSRARNFIDLLGNQRLTLDNTVDQALYDNWRQLKSKVEEHETLLAQATEEEAQKVYAGALSRLKNDLDSAMVKIQLANPQLSSLVSVQTISLARLQELTEPGTAFLSYYFAKDELFCWLIKKESVRLQRLPLSKLALGEFILDYRRRTQNLEPVTEMAAKLYQWLVAPLAADLAGEERLCIIPHGPLHYLSFATLFDGKDYLIDRYPLFYLPSGSVFEHTVARRQPLADKSRLKVLAIGNPDLGDPLFALPFAEHEVGTIHWNFPEVTVLTGKYATEKWLVENIGRFNVIHLASHGEFDPVNPLASALKLAGQREYDGDLRADEVLSLTINPDLVVLSACQTGLAKVTSGDDVIGLNRAFFYAGTHAMISSLWRVSDIATAVEVKHFYRMYPNNSKADSLRLAMLHVKNRFPHPGYWGAFTLVGDYQ